jgi:DNA transformation protein
MDEATITDLFAAFGPVHVKRMFGGLGLYAEGLMFAICVDGQIYLKTDVNLARSLREAGSHPFAYEKQGKTVTMNFWSLPESALDDGEALAVLARRAVEVARMAAPRKHRTTGNPFED